MAFAQLNGCRIHYEVRGSGPAMLFIHGLGSCLLDWEDQLEEFAKTHTVIAADQRGHGESARPAGAHSIQQFAADQVALLRALNISKAHVVGLSLGGAVAFQFAMDQPAMVDHLVIVNSAPDFILKSWQQKFFIWQRTAMLRFFSFNTLGKAVAKKMFPGPEQERTRALFLERYIRNDRPSYFASLKALFQWSIAQRLGELRCPVLVIAADQDYSPVSFKEAYVAKIAGAKLAVIADARHATPMERPVEFNRVLRNFIEPAAA